MASVDREMSHQGKDEWKRSQENHINKFLEAETSTIVTNFKP